MKKRLITNETLATRRDQCRVLRDGLSASPFRRTTSPFRRTIGPEFHEWIRGHWGRAGSSFLRPVQKLFRKLPSLPEFFPAAGREAAEVFNYTLLTQVQMNLALGVSNRMFFDNSRYSSVRASAAKVREPPGIRLTTESTAREFWLALSQLLFQTQPRDQTRDEGSFLNYLTGTRLPPGNGPRANAYQAQFRRRADIGSSFAKFVYTSRRWLQSLSLATLRDASGLGGSDASFENRLALPPSLIASNFVEKEGIPAWPALTLRKILHAAFKAGDQLSQHWSLPSLLISRPALRVSSSGGALAGVPPLTLVVAQRSSREVNTNTETRFAESSTLYFAKHASQLVEKLSSVLKEARQTQTEIRTVAPPQIEIDRLTRQVHQQLERELRIEKERRGL